MSRDLNVDQIRKLWILDLTIQSGSLKAAALKAKVSPSAISQALTSLEQAVGKTLLTRERGSIAATQDALAILDLVRPAFAVFDRLRELGQAPAPKMSWLNFGTYESIAIDLLPGLIHSLRERMPSLRLGLRISRTNNLLMMVRKGELCSALVVEVDDMSKFYVKPVAEDRLGLYVSNRHPIAKLGWAALDEFGLGSLAPGKDGHPRYFSKFMRQIDSVKPLILSDSFEALRSAAASGMIVAVLPSRVAGRFDDLLELTPAKSKMFKDYGQHRISIVSQSGCDEEEADFLALETSRFLNKVTR